MVLRSGYKPVLTKDPCTLTKEKAHPAILAICDRIGTSHIGRTPGYSLSACGCHPKTRLFSDLCMISHSAAQR